MAQATVTLLSVDSAFLAQLGTSFDSKFRSIDLTQTQIDAEATELAPLVIRLDGHKSFDAYCAVRDAFKAPIVAAHGVTADDAAKSDGEKAAIAKRADDRANTAWSRAWSAMQKVKAGALIGAIPKSAEPEAVKKAEQRTKAADEFAALVKGKTPAQLLEASRVATDASEVAKLAGAAAKLAKQIDQTAKDAAGQAIKNARESLLTQVKALTEKSDAASLARLAIIAQGFVQCPYVASKAPSKPAKPAKA